MATTNIKALLAQLTPFCKTGLESAAGSCVARSHYEITVEHVLWQMIESPMSDFSLLCQYCGITHEDLKAALSSALEAFPTGNTAKPVFSPRLIDWYQQALLEGTVELSQTGIRSGTLFLAFLSHGQRLSSQGITDLFADIQIKEIRQHFSDIIKSSIEAQKTDSAKPTATNRSAIRKYCEDFTHKAEQGHIDPVFGRDTEIRKIIDIFARRRKNNPIVVGEAGVGKTAVVEGLALRIVKEDVPDFLKGVKVMGLDMGLLQAGASVKGEFEKRLKDIIQEIKASQTPIILFIDEAHTMVGAGSAPGGSDAANLLKPALARGELRTVAATTWSEYKKYFEKDAALARRFQPVYLEEPSEQTAGLILRGLKKRYEQSHGVIIRDDAVTAAAELSSRYISGRYLPDKAIDLLDTSCARVKVLLTAKPAIVESLERKLQALEREKQALERDMQFGSTSDPERLEQIEQEMEQIKIDYDATCDKWHREQTLANEIISLRRLIARDQVPDPAESDPAESDPAESDPADPPSNQDQDQEPISKDEAASQINTKLAELTLIQAQAPLIKIEVDPPIVSRVVSDWTGIPVGNMRHDDATAVMNLEQTLGNRIKGQSRALAGITRIIKSAKAGIKDPVQPLGVFLLAGPSGVGKTETGLAIADHLFGGERFAVSVNMSEFQEKHTVSRLIGSPPGYVGFGEGGVLTEAVRQRPYSVVLLDEAEKANLEVMNLFYQVFDKGVLADGEGRPINFKNTIIFLTSNLGSDIIADLTAQNPDISTDQLTSAIRPVLADHFKPALLARMTIIPYVPLDADVMQGIVDLKLAGVADRLMQTHKIQWSCSQEVAKAIARRCLEVDTGARNIDHILSRTVLPMVSDEILSSLDQDRPLNALGLDLDPDGNFVFSA